MFMEVTRQILRPIDSVRVAQLCLFLKIESETLDINTIIGMKQTIVFPTLSKHNSCKKILFIGQYKSQENIFVNIFCV